MHPELNLQAIQLRHVELIGRRRFPQAVSRRRRFFRRRRDTLTPVGAQPAPIVLLPPPRKEHEAAGRDQRVA